MNKQNSLQDLRSQRELSAAEPLRTAAAARVAQTQPDHLVIQMPQGAMAPATGAMAGDDLDLQIVGGGLSSAQARELVFIESDVGQLDQMIAGLGVGREVHVLDASQDGLQQIAAIMAGRTDIAALHLVSHGSEAALKLGSLMLDANSLPERAGELRDIGRSLSPDADILLYGCQVGAGGSGRSFVGDLALITGADVAASDDRSGAAALGGDWALEVLQGSVETPVAVGPELAALYGEVLDVSSVTADFNNGGNFNDLGGTAANQNVAYKVSGSSNYSLLIDGADRGTYVNFGSYVNLDPDGLGESQVSFSFQAGNTFTPASLLLRDMAGGQTVVFKGYDASNVQVGSTTTQAIDAGGTTVNFSGMVNITTLKMTATTYSGLIQSTQLDDFLFTTVHALSSAPAITSATYNASTGVLSVTGTDMTPGDTIDVSKLTLKGEGSSTYTLTSSNVTASSATAFSVTLNGTDQAAVSQILNKNGTSSTGGTTFNLAAADDWDASVTAGDTSDASNGLTVSNVAVPTITSATYDASTGVISVTGTGLSKLTGGSNDIVANKFTFTGEGGSTYTLTDTANVEVLSATAFTLTLSATDKADVNLLANKNGTSSTGATTYNLAAAEDWAAGADAAVVVADLTGNGITVSNVAVPTISSATYNASTGVISVTGTGLSHVQGATNDIVANKFTFTGEGGSTYTLTDTANVEVTSATAFTLTLSATDKAEVNLLANKNGTSSTGATTYNLAAAEDWAAGADAAVVVADTTGNGVTVSNVAVPTITSATYDASTGAIVVTGTGLSHRSGATNDIVANKFTVTGEGGSTYTLTDTSNVEITSATAFTLTLSATDKAGVNLIANKNGASSTSATTYNLAAAEDWAAGADAAVVVADMTGNGVTVSNVSVPTITSATYDVSTGVVSVTGTGLSHLQGAINDIVANKFTFTGEGGSTYTLTDTSNVEVTSGTAFTLTLSATDKTAVNLLATQNGTASTDATTYNLAAAEDWAAGADAAVVVADLTGNGVTVSAVMGAAPTATVVVADTSLTVGETSLVTITFSTAVTGFSNADLTVDNGTLSAVSSGDGGVTWTATFTPTAGVTDASNVIALDMTGVAAGGTPGVGSTDSNNYAVDTQRPTATVVVTDGSLLAGETSLVTVTFSEAVTGFTNVDLSVANGTLSAVSSGDGGVTWTATLTPSAAVVDVTNLVTLDNTGVADAAGNAGTGSTDSNNYAVNTVRPTATVVVADSELTAAETSLVTFTFSEAVTGFTNADLSVANGSLSAVSSGDGGVTFSATLTPSASIYDLSNLIELDMTGVSNAAGNAGSGTQASNNYAVATAPPPATGEPPATVVDGVPVQTQSTPQSDGSTRTVVTINPVPSTRVDSTGSPALADVPLVTGAGGESLIGVGLPAGMGVTAQSQQGNGLTVVQQLSLATQTALGQSASLAPFISAFNAFGDSASIDGPTTVSLVTPTATTGSPVIVTLSGATGMGEGDLLHPLRQEAVVLDMRQMPGGSTLVLNNIDFAAIIGSARVTGGEGRNVVVGDGASQFICLGADDDELHGGGGDDTVASKGGDDQLFGDDGNDHVVGGTDNDTLHGGDGNDVLQGGHSDAGRWTFQIDTDGQLLSRFTVGDTQLSTAPDFSRLGAWTDDGQPRTSDERLSYSYQSTDWLELTASLFQGVADRLPSLAELNALARQDLPVGQLAQLAWTGFSAAHPELAAASTAAQVRALVQTFWGHDGATDAVVAAGVAYIEGGGTWADGLLLLARDARATAAITDTSGHLNLAQPYDSGELGWQEGSGDDRLFGEAGNDRLVGGGGNDWLDGGSGTDTAVFTGAVTDFSLHTQTVDGVAQIVLRNLLSGEVDTLVGIEQLEVGAHLYTLSAAVSALPALQETALADVVVELIGQNPLALVDGVPG
jgi:hypothetical protein